MPFRRLLLKDAKGYPRAAITIDSRPPRVVLPQGITALLCLTDEIFTPPNGCSFRLPEEGLSFSILCRRDEEILFASDLPPREASIAKWRLLSEQEKQGTPREEASSEDDIKQSLGEGVVAEEVREGAPREIPIENEREETEPVEDTPADGATLTRAKALLESGTPFPLFEHLMPSSRWAVIREDDTEYLIGIRSDEEGARVLFGIPGRRDLPPDDDRLWTFFPTDENEEVGYYLAEGGDGVDSAT